MVLRGATKGWHNYKIKYANVYRVINYKILSNFSGHVFIVILLRVYIIIHVTLRTNSKKKLHNVLILL